MRISNVLMAAILEKAIRKKLCEFWVFSLLQLSQGFLLNLFSHHFFKTVLKLAKITAFFIIDSIR